LTGGRAVTDPADAEAADEARRLSRLHRNSRYARRRRIGYRRLLTFPSGLAVSRLEREAKKRGLSADTLAALIFEILGNDDLYAAILDDSDRLEGGGAARSP
jgi:hypothetical protein